MFLFLVPFAFVFGMRASHGERQQGALAWLGLLPVLPACRWQRFSEFGYQKPQIISQITGVGSVDGAWMAWRRSAPGAKPDRSWD
uniref:Putative secreted protein n=1 Tax=Anopheles marajoara TaxID=58244 RepID=A0A2M4CBT8_9DIPT